MVGDVKREIEEGRKRLENEKKEVGEEKKGLEMKERGRVSRIKRKRPEVSW